MIDLKQGDCLELMKEIPDKSVDMVLCDLPYGTTRISWDTAIPFPKLWEQYQRIITDRGAILLFGDEPFASNLRMSNPKLYRYDWIWQKEKGTNFFHAKTMPMKVSETISVFYKHLPIYNPQMTKGTPYVKKNKHTARKHYGDYEKKGWKETNKNEGYRYPINILKYSCDDNNRNRKHPSQKPVALLEYLIKTYTQENDIVLDSCMGSGSTGVACINTNRNFIGYELQQDYFKIAEKRISDAIDARRLP